MATRVARLIEDIDGLQAAFDSRAINVRDAGAVGGGEETTAVDNAAVDDALEAAAAGSRRVFFPHGRYVLEPKELPCDDLMMYGCGPGSEIVLKGGSNAPLFYAEGLDGLTVTHLGFDGNLAKQSELLTDAFRLNACSNVTITHNRIARFFRSGVTSFSGGTNLTVAFNRFADNENDVILHNGSYARVIGNYCEGCRTESLASYEQDPAIGRSHHNIFEGNTIRNAYGGVSVQRSFLNIVANNLIENVRWGIKVYGEGDYTFDNIVANNVLRGGELATAYGIIVAAPAVNTIVQGNIIHDWRNTALQITATDTTAEGNRMHDCVGGLALSADDCTISRNTVKRTTAAAGMLIVGPRKGLVFDGNRVERAWFHGIHVTGAQGLTDSVISGNILKNNGQAEAGAYDGFYCAPLVRCLVVGNRGYDDQETKTQRKGFYVPDAGSQYLHFANNFNGNLQGPGLLGGSKPTGPGNQGDWLPNLLPSVGEPGFWMYADGDWQPIGTVGG